ncbi:surface protein [Hungatella hathewayi]|uniref:surface protein n=1 Tax=Hungatella hathewayi TaxID=154046 RepID=UPI001D273D16|nr:surface protein [Hungatella hathewayi]MBS6759618.1 surface protein [Hungatella hathewayi]
MRKYPLFVLAAAAAMSIASVPMTAHAAAFQVTGGGNGMSGYMTNCSGQTGNLAGIFNQLSATANGRGGLGCGLGQNYTGNGSCDYGQGCGDNGFCGFGQDCGDNGSCGFGQSCGDNGSCGFGQNCGDNESCGFGQSCSGNRNCGGNQNMGMNGQGIPFLMMR